MKKWRRIAVCFVAAFFVALQLMTCPLGCARGPGPPEAGAARFPASLVTVEQEAFEGTAFQTLVFPDGFLRVGERAFSNTARLTEARLPGSTVYIADSAFAGSALKRILGQADSYAQAWAGRRGIEYVVSDRLAAENRTRPDAGMLLALLSLFVLPPDVETGRRKQYLTRFFISMRPQDRPELNPIDYRFP